MKFSEKILQSLIKKNLGKDFEENLMKELSSQTQYSEHEMIEEIADNYLHIIKTLKSNYSSVSLNLEDFAIIVIDGVQYDLDEIISHDNAEISECRMAVESLIADWTLQNGDVNFLTKEVERILNNK